MDEFRQLGIGMRCVSLQGIKDATIKLVQELGRVSHEIKYKNLGFDEILFHRSMSMKFYNVLA
ncbi:hypothetical protein [Massilia sp.]|uniref:hypothetical protein n=1 Tax=Massilia sp. TaxID=1882437 RepID=UPI0028A2B92D|nr:hypothetical protein [Massilia sp.]